MDNRGQQLLPSLEATSRNGLFHGLVALAIFFIYITSGSGRMVEGSALAAFLNRYAPSKARWFILEALRTLYLAKYKPSSSADGSLSIDGPNEEDSELEADDKLFSASFGLGIRAFLEYPSQTLASLMVLYLVTFNAI